VAVVMAVLVAIAATAMSGVIATQRLRGLFLRV
jgi:Tfp pilus assembly protein FimT